jgi:hypothetical protein
MLSCSSVTHPRKDLFRALGQQDCQQHGHREQEQDGEDEYEHVPVGFQKSATDLDLGFYAVRSYSLMRPPERAGA